MSKVWTWIDGLSSPYAYKSGLRLFTALVYLWFVISAFLVWDIRELIWGPKSVLLRFGMQSELSVTYAYSLMFSPGLFPYIFYPHVIAAVLSIFEFRWVFIPRIITWITGILLVFAGFNAFNAGFMFMLLLAFYCIPINTSRNTPIQNTINHLGAYAAMIQIALGYGFSALYKLSGEMWPSGEAVYYALELRRFSTDWVTHLGITKQYWLMHLFTWIALGYQMLFPIAVWFSKSRKILIWIGVAMHVTIAVVMHLWDFSLAMLFSYAVFLKKK